MPVPMSSYPIAAAAPGPVGPGGAPMISHVTRIWDLGVHWPAKSQCSVWDTSAKGVIVFECLVAHNSVAGTQPPNPRFWRYLGKR